MSIIDRVLGRARALRGATPSEPDIQARSLGDGRGVPHYEADGDLDFDYDRPEDELAPMTARNPGELGEPDEYFDLLNEETSGLAATDKEPGAGIGPALAVSRKSWVDAAKGGWNTALREALDAVAPVAAASSRGRLYHIADAPRHAAGDLASALGVTPMRDVREVPPLSTVVVDQPVVVSRFVGREEGELAPQLSRMLDDGCAVLWVGDAPPRRMGAAVRSVHLGDLSPILVRAAAVMRWNGHPLAGPAGDPLEEAIQTAALRIPGNRLGVAKAWLVEAAKLGGADAELMEALAALVGETPGCPGGEAGMEDEEGPSSLKEVAGLPAAARERLCELARRYASRQSSPQGIVLSGPPGSGKSMLARILARESGRAFIPTSVSHWQSVGSGHLGDMLRTMRETFEDASSRAPSLMLIDELDTISTRTAGHDSHYWNAVINGFLENVRGASSRGDVVLVGATNNIGLIDPAVLRAGRFGETIEIPRPDEEGRAGILAFLLRGTKASWELPDLATRAGDCSQADLAEFVLEARAIAEASGEAFGPRHLDLAMSRISSRRVGGRDPARMTRSVAAGLCSEALMARLAYGEEAQITSISMRPGLADLGRVRMRHASGRFPDETAGDLLRLIHLRVAPAAGRLVLARSAAASAASPWEALAGFGIEGDMEPAREAARRLVASGATGCRPTHKDLRLSDKHEDAVLRSSWRTVMKAMGRGRAGLRAATVALEAYGELDGEEFLDLAFSEAAKSMH